jgi:hypothetical protein
MVRTAAAACPRGGGQAKSPDSWHRPQSVLGFNIGAQVARGSTVPAGWVFLADDSARIMNPPTGGLGGNNTAESRTRIT